MNILIQYTVTRINVQKKLTNLKPNPKTHMSKTWLNTWDNQDCNQSEKKEETLGGNKASMSASEAAGKRSLTVRLSFFLSAPDSLWCDFASTAFLNIFCVSVSVCFAEPKAKSYVRVNSV